MRARHPEWREALVLAVTVISVAALVGAGVSSYGDPDLAGRAALARLSGEVATGVALEWEQLRRDPALLDGSLVAWSYEPAPAPRPARRLRPRDGNVVAQALLIEARRLEREAADPDAALQVVLDVFAKQPDEARRAEARLYAIQLAVRTGQRDLAQAQWERARDELAGDECLSAETGDETSALLLCALAAAPALSLEQRARARDELVSAWVAGHLALPPASFAGEPLREAYRQRLQALLPESVPDPRLAEGVLAERARALAELAGAPVGPPPDDGARVVSLGEGELIYRRRSADTIEGRVVPHGTVAARLAAAAEEAGVLPPDFALDFAGDDEALGAVVRPRTTLVEGTLGFVVRHGNPDSVVSAVGERQALLRGALFLLAAGVGAAGFSVFRSLRRERHLAELKSTFVANVSHELRTPVSSILLMAENLDDERVTDAATRRRYHTLIRREAERLRRLVDDVLDFSRLERGKGIRLALANVDVQAFAREVESEARGRVAGAGGELDLSTNGVPASLLADEDALRRATMNLVENALKHSGVKDVQVELAGDGGRGLVIRVRDHGCGVPRARLEALFRPFERGERGDDSAAGTGLGLAIVREIAEGHGGRARALRPDDGPGLAFEISIPGTTTEVKA